MAQIEEHRYFDKDFKYEAIRSWEELKMAESYNMWYIHLGQVNFVGKIENIHLRPNLLAQNAIFVITKK
jgi:hypothetical protein